MQFAIEIPGQSLPANVITAFVVMVPGRSKARSVSNPVGLQRSSMNSKQRSDWPNVLAYVGTGPGVSLINGLTLLFSARLERPVPAYLVMVDVNGLRWRLSIDPVALVAGAAVQQNDDLESLVKGPQAYLKELWTTCACGRDPKRMDPVSLARCFFADLDRRTHPELIDACHALYKSEFPLQDLLATRLAVSSLMQALGEQLRIRAIKTGGAAVRTHLHAHLHNHAKFISRVFWTLAKKYFPEGKGADHGKLAEAFECFALGELTHTLPSGFTTTQPSSGYFIFFAELALFCRTAGIDAPQWTSLLNVLVRTQRAFFHVHTRADGVAQSNVGDYGPHTFDQAAATAFRNSGSVANLRADFASKGPYELEVTSKDYACTYVRDMVYPPADP